MVAVAVATVASVLAFNAGQGTRTTPANSPLAVSVDPGLVDVTATLGYQQAISAGTGMVLTPSGLAITNNHVIEGSTSITVTDVGNRRTYQARVAGYDQSQDIAVLQLAAASGLKTVSVGASSAVKIGEKVMALGNAGGKGRTPVAATGTISALGQSITAVDQPTGVTEQLTGLIRTNVPLQPGDSGGPLVSPAGQVIGMDTAASSQFQINSGTAQAFAIPASQAVSVAAQIVAGKASATVHIGATRLARRLRPVVRRPGAGPASQYRGRRRRSYSRDPGRRSRPGPWRRDRVARRARRHLSSRPPVGDRCVPPRERDQRGLGRPGRPDLHSHRGLGQRPGQLSWGPPSAVQAHEAETRTHGRAGRELGLYSRAHRHVTVYYMKGRFLRRSTVTRGMRAELADDLAQLGRPIAANERACCCPARPMVTVMMPPTTSRPYPIDLLLCATTTGSAGPRCGPQAPLPTIRQAPPSRTAPAITSMPATSQPGQRRVRNR